MNIQRNFQDIKKGEKVIGQIDRTYSDEIYVILPCGYSQRFWIDLTDEQAIKRCEHMKKLGIETNLDQ
jgi:hypothetical protein